MRLTRTTASVYVLRAAGRMANRHDPQAANEGRLGSVHPPAPGRSLSDG
jgi:hypothetical protein